jgi:molybdenum cofactor cytidylyltransferase
MTEKHSFGIIILAAGNSSRLGKPKQFLQFQGKSLIRHVAESCISAGDGTVVVVTGAEKERIETELKHLPIIYAHNSAWQDGMASSIVAGLNRLLARIPKVQNVIIAVSDQPFISGAIFQDLLKTAGEKEAGIIASSYDHVVGTPVLFSGKYFPELLALRGAEGAKKFLKNFNSDLMTIDFPMGKIDIDTTEDYDRLATLG